MKMIYEVMVRVGKRRIDMKRDALLTLAFNNDPLGNVFISSSIESYHST